MEVIGIILLIIVAIGYSKGLDSKATHYMNSHEIDTRKMADDSVINDLSGSQLSKNIINGKYDAKKK